MLSRIARLRVEADGVGHARAAAALYAQAQPTLFKRDALLGENDANALDGAGSHLQAFRSYRLALPTASVEGVDPIVTILSIVLVSFCRTSCLIRLEWLSILVLTSLLLFKHGQDAAFLSSALRSV